MKVLIACEYSGIVRDAFAAKGHDAWSCDILPTESPGNHFQGDVLEHLDKGWDLMIAHPPCTHLAVSGARWFTEGKKPWSLQEDALDFVRKLLNAPIDKIALENPVLDFTAMPIVCSLCLPTLEKIKVSPSLWIAPRSSCTVPSTSPKIEKVPSVFTEYVPKCDSS